MKDFQFYAPTKVVLGRDAEQQIGALVREFGGHRVLVHYGGESAKRSGLLDVVCDQLTSAGLSYVLLGGVVPNPRLSKVREGIALCKQEQVDFLLAVGGGSVIDSAKAIGYGLTNEGDIWDFYEKKRTAKACAPISAVVTIAAAGSEMSDSSVITNEDGWLKRGYSSNYARCKFAVMNPERTYTLPPYQTASGAVDILMHTMERYFVTSDTMPMTDRFCEQLLCSVMEDARILLRDPKNYDARAEIMWASSLSHNDLMHCGSIRGDWACHQLEHELGGMFDVAHGAGLAAIWGSWARYVYGQKPSRFARFAQVVCGCSPEGKSEEELALEGIAAMEDFFRSIQMPASLSELGLSLTEDQIRELSHKCAHFGRRTIGAFRVLDESDMQQIYRNANH